MPNLTEEAQNNIQAALDEIPDSLEEKQVLEKEQEEAAEKAKQEQEEANEKAKQEAEAKKEAERKAAELAESEKELRNNIVAVLDGDLTDIGIRNNLKELCQEYIDTYTESNLTSTIKQVMEQINIVDENKSKIIDIGPDIEIEYEKVISDFYGDYYINYKLEYAEGLNSLVGKIQDAIGEKGEYVDWVASNVEYFYGTEVPGDSVCVIRTKYIFPEEGRYSMHLIPDGVTRLSRSGGFEFNANVYREVSNEYIDAVCTKYNEYKNAPSNIENALNSLEQLKEVVADDSSN